MQKGDSIILSDSGEDFKTDIGMFIIKRTMVPYQCILSKEGGVRNNTLFFDRE